MHLHAALCQLGVHAQVRSEKKRTSYNCISRLTPSVCSAQARHHPQGRQAGERSARQVLEYQAHRFWLLGQHQGREELEDLLRDPELHGAGDCEEARVRGEAGGLLEVSVWARSGAERNTVLSNPNPVQSRSGFVRAGVRLLSLFGQILPRPVQEDYEGPI